jgi:hypothetical protein
LNTRLKVALVAVGGVVLFVLGFMSGSSGASAAGPDNLTAAEKGKSDAQAIVRNHTAGGDTAIATPEAVCDVAEKGVGFIRFYTEQQSQEYLAACQQEYAALTGQ